MSVRIYEAPADARLERLEDDLADAFESFRSALEQGEAVVVCLDDRDLQGAGAPHQAALAHGLLGLARALALEGRRAGWQIAVLASSADVEPAERIRWIEHLAEGGAASGALLRLGAEHLGRLPT